jgi:predicted deacylase
MTESTLKVGKLSAGPGERVADQVTLKLGEVAIQLPIFLINGSQDGPTLGITAGVHGAEFAGIAAAFEIAQNLDPNVLKGSVIVAPVANPPAFWQRSIYVSPLDQKNLNREFPGNEDGSPSQVLAHWLFEQVISQSDYYLDLHGGDMIEALVPFVIYYRSGNSQVDDASHDLAKSYGIRYLVESEVAGSSFSAASMAGIPAILTEAGQQGIWEPEMVETHVEGVQRVMRHLGMVEEAAQEEREVELLRTFAWLRSEHDGYYYPETAVGDAVSKGERLGVVRDYLGTELQVAESPASGAVLFLVTSLAINSGDPLLAVGAPEPPA